LTTGAGQFVAVPH